MKRLRYWMAWILWTVAGLCYLPALALFTVTSIVVSPLLVAGWFIAPHPEFNIANFAEDMPI